MCVDSLFLRFGFCISTGMYDDTFWFIDQMIHFLESGKSVSYSLDQLSQKAKGHRRRILKKMYRSSLERGALIQFACQIHCPVHQALFCVVDLGLKGVSIQSHLLHLRSHIEVLMGQAYEKKLRVLPFKLLVPMLFCFFPALAILFLNPYIVEFLEVTQGLEK